MENQRQPSKITVVSINHDAEKAKYVCFEILSDRFDEIFFIAIFSTVQGIIIVSDLLGTPKSCK